MANVDTIDSEMHAAELYQPGAIAPKLDGLAAVTDEQIAIYHRDGFLAVENAFSGSAVASAKDGLSHLVSGGNPEFQEIQFEAKAAAQLDSLSLDERIDAVRKLMYFAAYEPRLAALANDPLLLATIRKLLGEEPAMFQDMALFKPPKIGREKPWHQDHAYFDFPKGTKIVGVWIALDEATIDNGCMQFLPGLHHQGPIAHFQRRDWQICDGQIMGTRSVAAPLHPGGALLFDALVPHGTPTNLSPIRRRALQFHYAPKSAAKCTTEERLAVFGAEGKNVTC